MPTATAFIYPKLFSPAAHCIESKTSAQLNAMVLNRWEGTLEEVMALWWNLYTVDIDLTVSGHSLETHTSAPVCFIESSGFGSAKTPRDRICIPDFDSGNPRLGLVFGAGFNDYNGDGGGNLVFAFQKVYLNSSNGKYALMFLTIWTSSSGNLVSTIDANITTPYGDANGTPDTGISGTVTFLGQTLYLYRKASIMPELSLVVSNPVYYTY